MHIPCLMKSTRVWMKGSCPSSCRPSGLEARSKRMERASSIIPKLVSLSNWSKGAATPALMALPLFVWFIDKPNRAVMASFFPLPVPFHSKSTRGGMPFERPTISLFSSNIDRLNRAAAEFSLAAILP